MGKSLYEIIKVTPVSQYIIVSIIFFICFIILIIILTITSDRFKNPREYKNKGSTGEQLIYLALKKYGIAEKQFLRNVYIPTPNGTTEIDLIVLSRKGLLVFECKNYNGNIYGDGRRKKWIQYLGRKKFYFPNPISQNRYHAKQLSNFLEIDDLPIIPLVATTTNGKWKVKNIPPNEYFLEYSGHLKEIYHSLPSSEIMNKNIQQIYSKLKPLERPNEQIRQAHIHNLKNKTTRN